ncbi:hypothetical protein VTJ04DRAFT_8095 [Mycothermus thermophilus]|uniref:uncharacterized protein n=1 Tax=Humicola insolens TaxID=85995 RepID=UPI00374245D3
MLDGKQALGACQKCKGREAGIGRTCIATVITSSVGWMASARLYLYGPERREIVAATYRQRDLVVNRHAAKSAAKDNPTHRQPPVPKTKTPLDEYRRL